MDSSREIPVNVLKVTFVLHQKQVFTVNHLRMSKDRFLQV